MAARSLRQTGLCPKSNASDSTRRTWRLWHVSARFEDVVPEVDPVFNLVGGETQTRSWNGVAKGGALISMLAEPSQTEASRRGARRERFTARPDGGQPIAISALIDKGHMRGHNRLRFPINSAKR